MAACKPKPNPKQKKNSKDVYVYENAKDIKRRTRHEGDMQEAEAILSQELGGNPPIEYEPMPCKLDYEKLAVRKSLIKRFGGLAGALNADSGALAKHPGMGETSAAALKIVALAARRVHEGEPVEGVGEVVVAEAVLAEEELLVVVEEPAVVTHDAVLSIAIIDSTH